MSIAVTSPAELRARIRTLRDLTGNHSVANDRVILTLIQMYQDTELSDLHTILGGRAAVREGVRRGVVGRAALREFVTTGTVKVAWR